jgi:WD40 repeat protein
MDGHLGDVCTLTTSSDGNYIFSGARDNTIRAWEFRQHHCIREIKDQNQLMYVRIVLSEWLGACIRVM